MVQEKCYLLIFSGHGAEETQASAYEFARWALAHLDDRVHLHWIQFADDSKPEGLPSVCRDQGGGLHRLFDARQPTVCLLMPDGSTGLLASPSEPDCQRRLLELTA